MVKYQKITSSRKLFPVDWTYAFHVTRGTLLYADDVKIRWMMAAASISWAVELLLAPLLFSRPEYALMRVICPAWAWAAVFLLHGFGAIWRIYERRERETVAKLINGLGVAVWVGATVAQNISSETFIITTSLELIACLFLLGTFVSTGWTAKSTTV